MSPTATDLLGLLAAHYLRAWDSAASSAGAQAMLFAVTFWAAVILFVAVIEAMLLLCAVLAWLVNCTVLAVVLRVMPPHAVLAVACSAARMAHRLLPTLLPEQLSSRAQWYIVAAGELLPKGYAQCMTYRAETPIVAVRPHWSERISPNRRYMLYLWTEAANELARLRGRTMAPLLQVV